MQISVISIDTNAAERKRTLIAKLMTTSVLITVLHVNLGSSQVFLLHLFTELEETTKDHHGIPVSCGWTPSSEIWEPTTSHWSFEWSSQPGSKPSSVEAAVYVLHTPSGAYQKRRRLVQVFMQSNDLPVTQPTVLKHWRKHKALALTSGLSSSTSVLMRELVLLPLHRLSNVRNMKPVHTVSNLWAFIFIHHKKFSNATETTCTDSRQKQGN